MLSHGPFNYNRFDVLDEKKSKPDFLDMDKDGNKKESMKKASKDKDEKCDDCGKKDCGCDDKKKSGGKELPDFIKKNMKENQEVITLEFDDAANWLIENGICRDESGCEVWLEHAAPETLDALADRIQENRAMANGGHPLVGDGSKPKAPRNPKNKTQTMMGKDGKPLFKEGFKPMDQNKMQDKAAMKPDTPKGELQARKIDKVRAVAQHAGKEQEEGSKLQNKLNKTNPLKRAFKKPAFDKTKNKAYGLEQKRRADLDNRYGTKKEEIIIDKDDVLQHLIENDYVNNVVSAEAMFNHISDEFLESIEEDIMEGFQPLPTGKMAKQSGKAYGKEQDAVRKGDEAGANKQMQRRIAMGNPQGRKAQLRK